mgnify:CR=1 FL=1
MHATIATESATACCCSSETALRFVGAPLFGRPIRYSGFVQGLSDQGRSHICVLPFLVTVSWLPLACSGKSSDAETVITSG